MHRSLLWIALLLLSTIAFAQTSPPAAKPALQEGWEEIDQRMVFLTVQLSSVETSLIAVNNAIRASAHAQSVKQGEANTHLKGNELMDRNAGGPVSWDKFYGKTAEQFFYHPTKHSIYINPDPTPQRPPQLDYIYRANSQAAARAEADVAALGNQLQVLSERRYELEAQQEMLWAKISFQALASRELEDKPIYRFAPAPSSTEPLAKQQADGLGAISQLVITADGATAYATPRLETQHGETFAKLSQALTDARHACNEKLLRLPLLAAQLDDANTDLGRASAISKRLAEFAQNMADAHNAATQADLAQDETRKNTMRATLQQSLMGVAESIAELDGATHALATAWHVTPDVKTELPRVTFDWPVAAPVSVEAPKSVVAASPPSSASSAQQVVIKKLTITVEATHAGMNPVSTKVMLTKGQTFQLFPDETETWAKGTGSRRGKACTYTGYPNSMSNKPVMQGANWMSLRWRVGSTSEAVESGATITAAEDGELLLFCNDDKPTANTGEIHVVVRVP